jgi:tetratricopeptide (TPR) repeat protein
MKKIWFSVLVVLLAGSFLNGASLDIDYRSGEDQNNLFYPFISIKKTLIRYNHFVANRSLKEHDLIERGTRLGKVEQFPEHLSEKPENDKVMSEAAALYDRKEYVEAVRQLDLIYNDEVGNPHYLNMLGRTLFWVRDKKAHERSLQIYEKLIGILDTGSDKSPDILVVDVWFLEAYWKLGCLYLDYGDYEKAVFEISRSMLLGSDQPDSRYAGMMDQKYSYLTEAYFFLKNTKLNKYFYELALKNNPANQYVQKYKLP